MHRHVPGSPRHCGNGDTGELRWPKWVQIAPNQTDRQTDRAGKCQDDVVGDPNLAGRSLTHMCVCTYTYMHTHTHTQPDKVVRAKGGAELYPPPRAPCRKGGFKMRNKIMSAQRPSSASSTQAETPLLKKCGLASSKRTNLCRLRTPEIPFLRGPPH